jgi:hypothetical protein
VVVAVVSRFRLIVLAVETAGTGTLAWARRLVTAVLSGVGGKCLSGSEGVDMANIVIAVRQGSTAAEAAMLLSAPAAKDQRREGRGGDWSDIHIVSG